MKKPPHLRLIKSEDVEKQEELHERTFGYDLYLQGDFTIAGADEDELDEICRIGRDIVDSYEFRRAIAEAVYNLLAERLEEIEDPPSAS